MVRKVAAFDHVEMVISKNLVFDPILTSIGEEGGAQGRSCGNDILWPWFVLLALDVARDLVIDFGGASRHQPPSGRFRCQSSHGRFWCRCHVKESGLIVAIAVFSFISLVIAAIGERERDVDRGGRPTLHNRAGRVGPTKTGRGWASPRLFDWVKPGLIKHLPR